ncbi:MAG: hypothetical protein ACYTXA_02610 [Nostoc sp.]
MVRGRIPRLRSDGLFGVAPIQGRKAQNKVQFQLLPGFSLNRCIPPKRCIDHRLNSIAIMQILVAGYGINLDLQPRNEPLAAFAGLILCGGSGWTFTDDLPDGDGVSNPQPGVIFMSPLVRWAHLALWM